MRFILACDGTYKMVKSTKDISALLPKAEYILISNSTELKGKTYTIVDVDYITKNKKSNEIIDIDIEISYSNPDLPFCQETSLQSHFQLECIEKRFSIYPLIRQLFDFNLYSDNIVGVGEVINIDKIRVKTRNEEIKLNEFDMEKRIKKLFKSLQIITSVRELLEDDNHLILKNEKWYVDKHIPKHFEYLFYNLPDIETVYLFTENQFERFSSIKSLEIRLYDKTNDHTLYDIQDDEFFDSNEEDNSISCTGLNRLLETCIYFPQFLELEKMIYEKSIALEIIVATKELNYSLTITEEETRTEGLCLFKILNKLLQM